MPSTLADGSCRAGAWARVSAENSHPTSPFHGRKEKLPRSGKVYSLTRKSSSVVLDTVGTLNTEMERISLADSVKSDNGGWVLYSKHELADMFGVSRALIAKYLKMGILPPPSPPTGCTASYGAVHVERMRAIWGRNGVKDSNLTLADLAERWNPVAEEQA